MKIRCPHCTNDDKRMIEIIANSGQLFCAVCGKRFEIKEGKENDSDK